LELRARRRHRCTRNDRTLLVAQGSDDSSCRRRLCSGGRDDAEHQHQKYSQHLSKSHDFYSLEKREDPLLHLKHVGTPEPTMRLVTQAHDLNPYAIGCDLMWRSSDFSLMFSQEMHVLRGQIQIPV